MLMEAATADGAQRKLRKLSQLQPEAAVGRSLAPVPEEDSGSRNLRASERRGGILGEIAAISLIASWCQSTAGTRQVAT